MLELGAQEGIHRQQPLQRRQEVVLWEVFLFHLEELRVELEEGGLPVSLFDATSQANLL